MEAFLAPMRLIFSPRNPWLWIATSVLLSVLVNGLAWRYRSKASNTRGLFQWPVVFLREAGRFLYFVGLPYAALLSGLVPATQFGLVDQEWLRNLTLGLPLGLGSFFVLLFLRVLTLWREKTAPGGVIPGEPRLSFGATLREGVYQEIHWAFYRSAPLLTVEDRAQGVALGLGIVALEAWLNPAWRGRWHQPHLAATTLRIAGLAVVMAVVFGVTGNLWITLGLHVAVESASEWAWSRVSSASALAD